MLTYNPATMSTGVDSVDEQHRTLFAIANRLLAGMQSGGAKDEIGGILNDLARYATTHFTHEESCMARFACPVAQRNVDAHREFVRTLMTMRADFDRDGPSPTMAIRMQLELADWISRHIVGVDTRLRACVPADTRA